MHDPCSILPPRVDCAHVWRHLMGAWCKKFQRTLEQIQGPQDDGESSKRDPRRVNVQAQVSSRNLPENRVSSDGAHEEKVRCRTRVCAYIDVCFRSVASI